MSRCLRDGAGSQWEEAGWARGGGAGAGRSVARRGAGPAAARGAGRRRQPLRVFVLRSAGRHAAPPRARPAAVQWLPPASAPLREEAARRIRRGSPPARHPMPPPRLADLHGRAWGEPRLPAPPGLSRRSPPSACWPPWGCSCAQVPRRRARPAGGERRVCAALRLRARVGAARGPPRLSALKELRAPGSGAALGPAARAGVRGAGTGGAVPPRGAGGASRCAASAVRLYSCSCRKGLLLRAGTAAAREACGRGAAGVRRAPAPCEGWCGPGASAAQRSEGAPSPRVRGGARPGRPRRCAGRGDWRGCAAPRCWRSIALRGVCCPFVFVQLQEGAAFRDAGPCVVRLSFSYPSRVTTS